MLGSHQLHLRARHLWLGSADACLTWGAAPTPRDVFSPATSAAELTWLRPCHRPAMSWGSRRPLQTHAQTHVRGPRLFLGGCWAVLCPPRHSHPASHPGIGGKPGSGHRASEGHLGLLVTCPQERAPPWDRPFPAHPPPPLVPASHSDPSLGGLGSSSGAPSQLSDTLSILPVSPLAQRPRSGPMSVSRARRDLRDLVQGLRTLRSRSSSKNLDAHRVKEVKAGVEGGTPGAQAARGVGDHVPRPGVEGSLVLPPPGAFRSCLPRPSGCGSGDSPGACSAGSPEARDPTDLTPRREDARRTPSKQREVLAVVRALRGHPSGSRGLGWGMVTRPPREASGGVASGRRSVGVRRPIPGAGEAPRVRGPRCGGSVRQVCCR